MQSDSYRLSAMRATPFPNRLLDLTATLPETQARIVCLIVRMTLGWNAGSPGNRRASVVLTLRQLQRRAKRSSSTPVIEAVAALAREGVVLVSWATGGDVYYSQLAAERGRPMRIGIAPEWVEEAGGSGG